MRRRSLSGGAITVIVAVLAVVVLLIVAAVSYYSDSDVNVKITGKESVSTSSGHEYRVYTTGETYVVKDSWIKFRFSSADDYGRLQKGHVYRCKAFGYRFPLFSSFKNLHDCKEVTTP